jgi:hypothetical protein
MGVCACIRLSIGGQHCECGSEVRVESGEGGT